MGIGSQIVEALAKENTYKPIRGEALLIGRQTVYYPVADLLELLRQQNIKPAIDPAEIEFDSSTIDRLGGFEEARLISDVSLMKVFGADRVLALDHSSYENADIVHDLRYPMPPQLFNCADIIVDGSTLDNVFTPSIVLQNFTRLLRPGGRMFLCNAYSSFETAYVILPPMWYVDYFVMNGFADCRVYVILHSNAGSNTFCVDLEKAHRLKREMGYFPTGEWAITLAFAEKGQSTTHDRLPIQQDYRTAEDWKVYDANLAAMLSSKRPHLARSNAPPIVPDVQGGYRYMNPRFEADDRALEKFRAEMNSRAEGAAARAGSA